MLLLDTILAHQSERILPDTAVTQLRSLSRFFDISLLLPRLFTFGSTFSHLVLSSSSSPLFLEIVEDLIITFGLVHGLSDQSSSTLSKEGSFFFGVAFPVLAHSSL